MHVDAYRLGGIEELDDLDLDTSLDEAVTVVEWGEGIAEGLADARLEVRIGADTAPDTGHTAETAGLDGGLEPPAGAGRPGRHPLARGRGVVSTS